jgi:hypothetical protein
MFRRTIPGSCMDRRLWRGRDGIHIREFGLAAGRSCRLGLDLESVSLEDTDGAGAIGGATGVATTSSTITPATIREARLFTTAMCTTAAAAVDLQRRAGRDTGHRELAHMVCTTIPGHPPNRSKEISMQRGDTRSRRIAIAVRTPVRSAVMTMAESREATQRAGNPASMAAEAVAAGPMAVAGITNSKLLIPDESK